MRNLNVKSFEAGFSVPCVWGVLYLGLIVGREYLGTTLHRGVVILEVFLNLLYWMGAATGRRVERLTWTEGALH